MRSINIERMLIVILWGALLTLLFAKPLVWLTLTNYVTAISLP